MAVTVVSVGGLADGRVVLPAGPLAALAGANGTGKSKLLACLLSPWTSQIPAPRTEEDTAEAVVELQLEVEERSAIAQLSRAIGWGDVEVPEVIEVGVRRGPLIGQQRFSRPEQTVLAHLWSRDDFLAAHPSLNLVYLPAERRLLEPAQQGIDLNELSEAIAYQKGAESRQAVSNYGRLDDREFENFAKALCVAASLPADDGVAPDSGGERVQWEDFQATVNALIAPKELLGLTRAYSDQLRVRTAQGGVHSVRDLSSGERQALIIMSRVLRAGTRTPLVMIDEPDAYLHPHLSKRLILALEDGVGAQGQLVVATHSPAILDGVPPAAILRLEHGGPPRYVADETERLELYRQAGFRSSALTQSDLLLITEGSTDALILGLAIPELSRASVKDAGGKAQVLRQVEQLLPFELPVFGVVDRDLNQTKIEDGVKSHVFVWPTADIEGLYLSEESALQMMVDMGLTKTAYRSVEQLNELIKKLCEGQRENVITEIARGQAVLLSGHEWPSPRGNDALTRLRTAVGNARPISSDELEKVIADAEQTWDKAQNQLLGLVRGKYVLPAFVTEATELKNPRSFLEILARHKPHIPALEALAGAITERLDQAP
ncbi:ATP-dependent nuclease [Pseudarthrobacter oxydans]|uniref:ATP-dependent nuclease n=1 Tax=Pseudarthrobacter oxydans TaxID=1671 RepID=UPI003442CEDD